MTNIKHMEAVFNNGDKLILTLKEGTKFAGHNPATLYELFYAEYVDGHYNVYQTEYFPKTEFGKASQAFNTRLTCSNPMNESEQGYPLNVLLERTPVPVFTPMSLHDQEQRNIDLCGPY